MNEGTVTRFDWCDLSKGLCMLMVVYYHSEVYFGTGHDLSWIFDPVFLTGFFFMSGYLFSRDLSKVSFRAKSLQVIRGILFPYFCFSLAFALPKVLSGRADINQLIVDIVTLRASWFVIVVGVFQIVYAGFARSHHPLRVMGIGTLLMFLIGLKIMLFAKGNPHYLDSYLWLNSPELPGRLPLCINIALIQSPFFYTGIVYRRIEYKLSLLSRWYVPVISTILYLGLWGGDKCLIHSDITVVVNYYDHILLVYLYALIGIVALVSFSKYIRKIRVVNYVGRNSILFYFLNGMILSSVTLLVSRLGILKDRGPLNVLWVAVVACTLMLALSKFINRYLPLLTGSREAFNRISSKLGLKIKW